jgi:hypothetical protein
MTGWPGIQIDFDSWSKVDAVQKEVFRFAEQDLGIRLFKATRRSYENKH